MMRWRRLSGSDGLGAVYAALGTRVHEQGQPMDRTAVEAAVEARPQDEASGEAEAAVGLPAFITAPARPLPADAPQPDLPTLSDGDEQQDSALLLRQAGQRRIEIAQFQPVALRGAGRHHEILIFHGQRVQARAPQLIDAQVMHDAEQPGAQVAALAPLGDT